MAIDTSRSQPMQIQSLEGVPGLVYFRYDEFGADSYAAPHTHEWGHLNYALHGTLQMDTPDLHMLSPPQYGVWIPPRVEHSAYARHAVVYRSVYLAPEHCARLPAQACSLRIGPIIKAILGDFTERDLHVPEDQTDLRLAQVLVDQLAKAPVERCYLPLATSPALATVLDSLQNDPGDHRTLAEWAATVHVTERSLARMCQRELGMTLGDWRQRLRFLRAIDALEARTSVQEIAFDLGYSTASAFIAMFHRQAGCTPEQYRREFCG